MHHGLEIYKELANSGKLERFSNAKDNNELTERAKIRCAEVKKEIEARGIKVSENFEKNFARELDDRWGLDKFGPGA